MIFQLVIVVLLFIVALWYIGRNIYKSITAKSGCGTNCKCGVDFSNIDELKTGK